MCAVSTGVRFTTLPDATPPSFQPPQREPPSQTPTTITAVFNPMMGHISGAYAARVSRELSLASRFDFNVYSYESEWTIGAEWWTRRRARPAAAPDARSPPLPDPSSPSLPASIPAGPERPPLEEISGVVKARASTSTVGPLILVLANSLSLPSAGGVANVGRARTEPPSQFGCRL